MAFHIGEIYRYSYQNRTNTKPEAFIDGLPNYFYETYSPNNSTAVQFQRGIHNIAAVTLPNGSSRIPAIIISSSPHKAGTDITPWDDDFDPDYGHIRYFGDNKTHNRSAEESPGNARLLKAFLSYSSPDAHERMIQGVPLIFFKRVEYHGRKKGNLQFQGYGLIESVELVTQFDPKLKTPYFPNYVFNMCVFSMAEDNEGFSWDWINARRDPAVSDEDAFSLAPAAWKKWVREGSTSLYKVRRTVSSAKIIPDTAQKPVPGSKEESTLLAIYNYYQNKQHIFELLAMRVAQEVFEESGTTLTPGWITQRGGDRGIDFVARIDISSHLSAMKIVVLGQAKCEAPDRPTNGVHIARTVARLKRGWFGVYVTTSYFSRNVQLEVLDDSYPIMLICGKKLAETVEKIIYKKGITLDEFLNSLEQEYRTENRRTEDILYS